MGGQGAGEIDAGERERAGAALRAMDAAGKAINFQALAQAAGVSRQWLYQQPELRAEVERLRERQSRDPTGVPSAQRSSDPSLRQRNRALLDENARLRTENVRLTGELALAYGAQRRAPSPA